MPQAVSDSLSNTNEQIEQAAKAIGRGEVRRKVFEAIYHHKSKVKSVADIVERTGLTRTPVLQSGRHFHTKGIVRQTKKDGDTAYEKIDFFHAHKKQILALAGNKKKIEALPTKRRPRTSTTVRVMIDTKAADTKQITIDDIDSFTKVRKVATDGFIPRTVSEAQFKKGVQSIIGEQGKFQDWGGERNDLLSTRLRINGKRMPTAFAFKGPGKRGPLVPGKMGKNGDQIQRLFESTAEVFLLQYGEEIRESVIDQMHQLAIAKSAMTAKKILFGVIDGADSNRLFEAYKDKFMTKSLKKK